MKWMFLPFFRITDYRGRSNRREYWLFQLLKVVGALALAIGFGLTSAVANAPILSNGIITALLGNVVALVVFLIFLLCFLPAEIALTVRRWHDIGNSGWTIVVVFVCGLIPIIGFLAGIVHFAAMCWPGDKNINKYGPPPTAG
jgi:uncharacterized membrane protein YhaH (DUF805 family)